MKAFDLPISFLNNKSKLQEHLIKDLELRPPLLDEDELADGEEVEEVEKKGEEENDCEEDDKSLCTYNHLFNTPTVYSHKIIPLWSNYYTSDPEYIKDTQKLLKGTVPESCSNVVKVEDILYDIRAETGFYSKYNYLDNSWAISKMLNNQPLFLQVLCMYNITSPIFSLVLPIFFLILPFFIIKIQGYSITLSKYIEVLTIVCKRHQLGKLFALGDASWKQRIYILISIGFYIFQTYQNVISCTTFYNHSKIIHKHLLETKTFISSSVDSMNSLEKSCSGLNSYKGFIDNMKSHKTTLEAFQTSLVQINEEDFILKRTFSMGHIMQCFNKLYNDKSIIESIDYTLYLQAYFENLKDIQGHIKDKKMTFCSVSNKSSKFKNAYFPSSRKNIVKNSYKLDKNILITGPNAAGKTTILKTTLLNLLISQQIGCGFYSSAKICPYDVIHSYLNIPDTSGRDSLFQAEARRCVNILKDVQTTDEDPSSKKALRHFCVFDELYSGTNPYEAIGAAIAFLKYLKKYKNMSFMITTHFLEVCKRLDNHKDILNCNMDVNVANNDFTYTYKMEKGISKIKGAVKVLKDLDYPEEIINETKEIIETLNI